MQTSSCNYFFISESYGKICSAVYKKKYFCLSNWRWMLNLSIQRNFGSFWVWLDVDNIDFNAYYRTFRLLWKCCCVLNTKRSKKNCHQCLAARSCLSYLTLFNLQLWDISILKTGFNRPCHSQRQFITFTRLHDYTTTRLHDSYGSINLLGS